jgi:hypothetical protein
MNAYSFIFFQIDITWFPFDDQDCIMKFGSWTYPESGINLTLASSHGDVSTFKTNGVIKYYILHRTVGRIIFKKGTFRL